MRKVIIIDISENNGHVLMAEDDYGNIRIFKTNTDVVNFIKHNSLCIKFPCYIFNIDTLEVQQA